MLFLLFVSVRGTGRDLEEKNTGERFLTVLSGRVHLVFYKENLKDDVFSGEAKIWKKNKRKQNRKTHAHIGYK